MKFSELEVGEYFRFVTDKQEVDHSIQKTSPFGYTDPKNKVLGEVQVHFNPEVVKVP